MLLGHHHLKIEFKGSGGNIDEIKGKESQKLIDKLLSYIVTINDLSDVTQSEILEGCRVSAEQYNNAL